MTIKAIETCYKNYRFRSRLEARWAVCLDALKVRWEYEPEGFDLGEDGWYLPDFWLPDVKIWIEIKPSDCVDYAAARKKAARLSSARQEAVLLLRGSPGFSEEAFYGYSVQWQAFRTELVAGYGYETWSVASKDDGAIWFADWALDSLRDWLIDSSEEPLLPAERDEIRNIDLWSPENRQHVLELYAVYLHRNGKDADFSIRSCESVEIRAGNGRLSFVEGHNMATSSMLQALSAARSARFEHGETPA